MKSHFDILDFCLTVFLFSILASGGLSFLDNFSTANTQVALVSKTLSPGGYYPTYSESGYGDAQTQFYGNYGNTGSPGNVGVPKSGGTSQDGQGGGSEVETDRTNAEQKSSQNSLIRYGAPADCKQNVVPKGTFHYPTGVDKNTLGIIVDPVFEAKMKKERFTPDLPVTPIYDLIVEAVPIFGVCYTDAPEKFSTEPPKTLPFSVSIFVEGEVVVGPGTFVKSNRKDESGRLLYEWKIPGWKDGIAKGEKLEKLIEAIDEKKSVKIVVDTIKQDDGTFAKEETEASFGLCAPIWGSGEHKFVFERGKSAGLDIPGLVSARAEKVREGGFEKIEPYRKYSTPGIDEHPSGYFSHIVDLVNHDDSLYLYGIASSTDPKKYMKGVTSDSSCHAQKGGYERGTYNYVLYANAQVLLKGASIKGIASPESRNAVVASTVGFDVVMHEVGHLFIDLLDEDDGFDIPNLGDSLRASKNCSFEPESDFTYKEKWYASKPGDITKGCNHSEGMVDLPPDDPLMQAYRAGKEVTINSDTPHTPIYRPSPTSLMNYGEKRPLKHNIVSCGWGVAEIKQQGTGPDYFQECLGLDTVKPSGISLEVGRLLAATSGALPIAQSSGQAELGRLDGVIFERDTSLGNAPPAGVVWYSGEPMPSSLKFLPPTTSSGSSTPTMSSSTPYQGHAASPEQMEKESIANEVAKVSTQPKPSLWRRIINFFRGAIN